MPSFISSSETAAPPRLARLTASDRPGVAQPVPERPVPALPWGRIFPCAVALALMLLAAWEWHWRDYGVTPSYRDDNALWAIQRRRIDSGEPDATVLIGSSRMFFDVQLPAWERLSGRRPIQLANVGNSPTFVLEHLADDTKFTGRVLVGIAPDLFFGGYEERKPWLKYFAHQSPSERVGKWLSMRFVEPYVAFYDDDFALFTVLKRLPWPLRSGKHPYVEVRKLEITGADRSAHMWAKVENDARYRALAQSIWAQFFAGPPPTPQEAAETQRTREKQIARAVAAVEKLRARHVPVLFLRAPSAGKFLEHEERELPRASTWDVLLARTGASGIHFQDYPELQGYNIPEWSHLAAADADRFTVELYKIIDRDFGRARGVHW